MTHPHLLHCRAALWSLNTALAALHQRAREEADQIAAEQANATEDGLRSTVLGVRSPGGHGDPVAGTALATTSQQPRPNRYAQLEANVTDTLGWLANQLDAPAAADPLNRLLAAAPQLLPGTAATVTRWIEENDRRIRDSINLTPHLWALPGAPECPSCGLRALYVQTAAPTRDWTVVCRTGCLCVGVGCRCGMPVRVEGVAHIWDRTAPIVTQALDTTRTEPFTHRTA